MERVALGSSGDTSTGSGWGANRRTHLVGRLRGTGSAGRPGGRLGEWRGSGRGVAGGRSDGKLHVSEKAGPELHGARPAGFLAISPLGWPSSRRKTRHLGPARLKTAASAKIALKLTESSRRFFPNRIGFHVPLMETFLCYSYGRTRNAPAMEPPAEENPRMDPP